MPAHLKEAAVVVPVLGGEDRLHRGFHIVINAALAAAFDAEEDGVVRRRCADLKRRIEEMFRVKLHERTVGKQLKASGYVRLSVRPQHRTTFTGGDIS